MNKLVVPLAMGLAVAFSGSALAGGGLSGCGGIKSAQTPQQTVMQTPAPEKPVVPKPVKKPTKG